VTLPAAQVFVCSRQVSPKEDSPSSLPPPQGVPGGMKSYLEYQRPNCRRLMRVRSIATRASFKLRACRVQTCTWAAEYNSCCLVQTASG
jgi:hypothetical protein